MHVPELLAPAGSLECLHAAVKNGADAVYFGLATTHAQFNARARAKNIPLEQLGETMRLLHSRGVKGYVTLNTLVHDAELPEIEALLRRMADAHVDAVLVQDFGVARLARQICPELLLHASTQMSLASRRAMEQAATLGIRRVVLPRELSLEQIAGLCQGLQKSSQPIELECFIHGALCMSFSGQCYASLGLVGAGSDANRSANRGRCAQPCRLPYMLLDAVTEKEIRRGQLLSPCDLAALPILPRLMATGIHALKIEGRLKTPEYVAETTRIYRNAIDEICKNPDANFNFDKDIQRLELVFSRGFSTGWFEGIDPRRLVPGNITDHRGLRLGTVIEVRRDAVVVQLCHAVRRGDGVLFEGRTLDQSQGGRVYEIFRHRESVQEAEAGAKVLLTFANHSLDDQRIQPGQTVYKTDDPKLEREIRRSLRSSDQHLETRNSRNKIPLHLEIRAVVGEAIQLEVRSAAGNFHLTGETPLVVARKHPLTEDVLREQLDRLGQTDYQIVTLHAVIEGGPMLPLSLLGKLRRDMIDRLDTQKDGENEPASPPPTLLRTQERERIADFTHESNQPTAPVLHLLLRDVKFFNETILQRSIDVGCRSFYGEFRRLADYRVAAEIVRKLGAEFVAVLPRIIKPGEVGILNKIAALKPNAVLVRNLEEIVHFRTLHKMEALSIIADFSLNAVNKLSFQQLFDWGVQRVTPGWDFLDAPGNLGRIEQLLVGRIPLFTSEHCLWRANLVAPGKPCENCCENRPLKLRDRYGAMHHIRCDLFCRMIVENSTPVEAHPWAGCHHFRIEWDERLGEATPDRTLAYSIKLLQEHV